MDKKAQDALVILKLYELRSESLMRTARAWFFSEFNPQSGKDILALLQSGEKQSAFYRMVGSHWEVAASLVNNGAVAEKLFLDANQSTWLCSPNFNRSSTKSGKSSASLTIWRSWSNW